MGINGNVYPFRELDDRGYALTSLPNWVSPGSLRYAANEAWSNLRAAMLGKFDIYHPTTYLRMPMVRAGRVIATHNECTHERFRSCFPTARKFFGRASGSSPGWTQSSVARSRPGKICCTFTMSIRQNPGHLRRIQPTAAERQKRPQTSPANTPGLHPVCWDEGGF